MSYLQTRILTHAQKVCSLYKRAARNVEAICPVRAEMRKDLVLLRHRFDQNKNIKDLILAKKLLVEGEEELFQNLSQFPKQFANSPGGVAYGREAIPPDWVLDFWHPIEKAAYPDYFARRELRKKEFIKLYENNFGRGKD